MSTGLFSLPSEGPFSPHTRHLLRRGAFRIKFIDAVDFGVLAAAIRAVSRQFCDIGSQMHACFFCIIRLSAFVRRLTIYWKRGFPCASSA